ncbi:hypothetical protein BB561_005478 [Smittium simulii]|uniref:Uncharacterized protein n=1 Tax=Smittium simulii TaxID=133385 RepID=A0A2T9YA89_9FUNG|nr:hypothetical protein BB561_005478 [Smittium simulii]
MTSEARQNIRNMIDKLSCQHDIVDIREPTTPLATATLTLTPTFNNEASLSPLGIFSNSKPKNQAFKIGQAHLSIGLASKVEDLIFIENKSPCFFKEIDDALPLAHNAMQMVGIYNRL